MNILLPTMMSLRNMIAEMNRKQLDLKRICKTASLLLASGLSQNSIPHEITERCISEQQNDGGWIGVVDTMWNAFFLKSLNDRNFDEPVQKALDYIRLQENRKGLWGRSQRDISRIPVTGALFFLFPQLASPEKLALLEDLWSLEKKSLTYKAAYTLMGFRSTGYSPKAPTLINDTVFWLRDAQREDGGYAPWKDHPAASDIFCTSVALMGLLQYPVKESPEVMEKSFQWILRTRTPQGIWPFHEIEDGASWGLLALSRTLARYPGLV